MVVPQMLTEAEETLLKVMVDYPMASSAELGEVLGVAASTVRKRQGAIRAKLGGENGDLLALARRRGLPRDTATAANVDSAFVEAS